MTTTPKTMSGRTRFDRFRDVLRERGFRLQCCNQATDKEAENATFERWIAANTATGTGKATMFIVVIGADGFDLYLQSQSVAYEADVQALVAATEG